MSAEQALPEIPPPRPRDPSRERTSIGLNSVVRLLLVLALFGMANYLAARHFARADVTRHGLYSLSAKTKRVVRGLHTEIKVDVFLSQGDPIYGDVKELFSRYRAASSHVHVRFIDPDLDRARFDMMKARYGIREGHLPDGRTVTDTAIVVSNGERHWFVTQDDMVEMDFGASEGGGAPELKGFKAEGALTSAILNVTQTGKLRVCFTKGHGEMGIDDGGERGLQHFAEALKRDNFETQAIETYGHNRVPAECDALVVAGPTRPFAEEENALLRSYVDGGGKLALLLDPIMEGTRFERTGLEGLAQHYGIEIDQDIVVETDQKRLTTVGGLETFAAMDWGSHALADPFKEAPLLVSIARSVRKGEGSPATELVKTSGESWGETDLARMQEGDEPSRGDGDVAPPASLAAAVETGSGRSKGRLVIVGDADFLARPLFENPTLVNQDFGVGIVSWLSQREALISIAPKDVESVHMNLSEDQIFWIRTYAVFCMPLAAFFLGLVVWLRRRQ